MGSKDNVVAEGSVYPMTEAAPTMHCMTFPDACVRVSIEKALSGGALLPLPNGSGEHLYVKDAVGSFVAWPKEFVILENVVVSLLTIFYILIFFSTYDHYHNKLYAQ